jgi:hypothetical protein
MIRLHLIAEFENADNPEDARGQLDAFRETVQPSTEYGIHIYENSVTFPPVAIDEHEGDSSEPGHPNNPRSNYDTN